MKPIHINDRTYFLVDDVRDEIRIVFKDSDDISHVITLPIKFYKIATLEVTQPKKKVKKLLHGWVNVYGNGYMGILCKTQEQCKVRADNDLIACVEINQEYEVEE